MLKEGAVGAFFFCVASKTSFSSRRLFDEVAEHAEHTEALEYEREVPIVQGP